MALRVRGHGARTLPSWITSAGRHGGWRQRTGAIHGPLTDVDLDRAYASADVLVLASAPRPTAWS